MSQQRKTFLIFDFETSGVGEVKGVPYEETLKPLPRPNYPVQLAFQYVDSDNVILKSDTFLIRGVQRLDPWVLSNCADISVKDCDRDGISFSEALSRMADAIEEADDCTLVAHNIQYDWGEVIVKTVQEENADMDKAFLKMKSCKQYCTCVNRLHKNKGLSYFYKKLNKWIGPNLKKLASMHQVSYEEGQAHDAMYDVNVTRECFAKGFMSHVLNMEESECTL